MKVKQFIIDLLNVNFNPQNIIVAVDTINNSIVQSIQFLQQSQFLLGANQLRIFSYSEAKQLLAAGVGGVFTPQFIKTTLKIETIIMIGKV